MSFIFEELKKDKRDARDVSLFGAFPSDCEVEFRVKISSALSPKSVVMVIHADGWDSGETVVNKFQLEFNRDNDGYAEYRTDLSLEKLLESYELDGEGLFYYHYAVETAAGYVYLGGEKPCELVILENFVGERQLLVYRADYRTSSAFSEGVIYHIFVDRFRKSGKFPKKSNAILDENWDGGIPQYGEYPGAEVDNNVFFGGDLCGIAEKIDYIAELGVRTIYLSPVFEAYSNHKYDTGNYLKVDSMFGGDKALAELCRTARNRGIKVILDGVFNHTGDDSVYFNRRGTYGRKAGAYRSKKSVYYPWYTFTEYPDEYECWWGVKIMPRVNSANVDYRRFICDSVVKKWMTLGVSGWRLDVADELSNEFLYDFRKSVKSNNSDAVVIGEVWEDASDKVSYGNRRHYLGGRQLDSVMNYPLRNAVIEYVKNGNCDLLRRFTEGTYRRYPKCTSDNLMNFLGTHDTERIITILSGQDYSEKTNDELAVLKLSDEERSSASDKLMLAYSIIGGLPGVPCVFYGDEVGLEGYRDPFCRKPFPWKSIDSDENSWKLLGHYRKIGMIRRDNAVFRDGLFRLIELTPDYVIYSREPYSDGDEKIIVCACRSGEVTVTFTQTVRTLTDGANFVDSCTLSANEYAYFACPTECEVEIK